MFHCTKHPSVVLRASKPANDAVIVGDAGKVILLKIIIPEEKQTNCDRLKPQGGSLRTPKFRQRHG